MGSARAFASAPRSVAAEVGFHRHALPVERRAEDELPRVYDAEGAGGAVDVGGDFWEAAVPGEVAHVELKRGGRLVGEKARAVAEEGVRVEWRCCSVPKTTAGLSSDR